MPRHKRGMTHGTNPEETPEKPKRERTPGKRKAKKRKLSKRRIAPNRPSRARASDPDKSAADLPDLKEVSRDVRIEVLLQRLEDEGEEITVAARAVGIDTKTLWRWRRALPDLDADLAESYRIGTETLVAVAKSRAVHGWEEPVFHCGKQCGKIRKYDHNLLQFLIRKRDPAFRDPKYAAPVTAPKLPGEVSLDLDLMPPELLAKLEAEARRQAEVKASGAPALTR